MARPRHRSYPSSGAEVCVERELDEAIIGFIETQAQLNHTVIFHFFLCLSQRAPYLQQLHLLFTIMPLVWSLILTSLLSSLNPNWFN